MGCDVLLFSLGHSEHRLPTLDKAPPSMKSYCYSSTNQRAIQ